MHHLYGVDKYTGSGLKFKIKSRKATHEKANKNADLDRTMQKHSFVLCCPIKISVLLNFLCGWDLASEH